MSGGVDSSVTLRLLAELDLNLSVLFMHNWDPLLSESSPPSSSSSSVFSLAYPSQSNSSATPNLSPCQWQLDFRDVQRVASHVGIPSQDIRMVDLTKEYWNSVFEPALSVWQTGGTPNPDVGCNREVKFGALMSHLPSPSHYLATGHYGRISRSASSTKLLRSKDMNKDQTYYLSSVPENQLKRAVFPLADIPKPRVRELARHFALPTAEREESMGVCFIGERGRFGNFISQYTAPPTTQGYLVTTDGTRLRPHDGLWHLTIGQRARVGGLNDRWFVARKGVGSGQDVLVVPGFHHPALQCTSLTTRDFNWIHDLPPVQALEREGLEVSIQVRHRMPPVRGVICASLSSNGVMVKFNDPLTAVSPGQVVAVWDGEWCLGSGEIVETQCLGEQW